MINAPTGYITKIDIKFSRLHSDEPIRDIYVQKRGCRFPNENTEVSSIKWYSKISCLFDCNMEFAENMCGCRPWDYPSSGQKNKAPMTRVCDLFGNSCFNRALQENTASHCDKKCVPGCD